MVWEVVVCVWGGVRGESFAPRLERGSLISALTGEEDCFPANAAALGDQRALSQAKVDATTGTLSEEGNTHPSITAVSHLGMLHGAGLLLPRRQSVEDRLDVGAVTPETEYSGCGVEVFVPPM